MNMQPSVIQCGWANVPHLSAEFAATMLKYTPAHEIAARGLGSIHPIPVSIEDLLWTETDGMTAVSRADLESFAAALAEAQVRRGQKKFYTLFPDEDTVQPDGSLIYARAKYPKHLEFFRVGATHREKIFLAGNRIGKTVAGAYETSCHLTGLYPDWWEGKRFVKPIRAWAAGKTNETTRDIIQKELLGEIVPGTRKSVDGTGLIPGAQIGAVTWKQGVNDLIDTIKIRHTSGGWSTLGLKSYQQGRGVFEGTAQHVIWADEECPIDIYGEMLIRTATTDGVVYLTFTPLEGLTETVMQFMPQNMRLDTEE